MGRNEKEKPKYDDETGRVEVMNVWGVINISGDCQNSTTLNQQNTMASLLSPSSRSPMPQRRQPPTNIVILALYLSTRRLAFHTRTRTRTHRKRSHKHVTYGDKSIENENTRLTHTLTHTRITLEVTLKFLKRKDIQIHTHFAIHRYKSRDKQRIL